MQKLMVRMGSLFFRWRNAAFPAVVVVLYALQRPPAVLLGSETAEGAKDAFALGLCLCGLALRLAVLGYSSIRLGGANKKFHAEGLLTGGMFGLCRNPLYTGNMLIYSGLFLMHGGLLVVMAGIGFFAFFYMCLIAAEEDFLQRKFGEAYRAYCAETPRWLPDWSKLRASTQGAAFDSGRAIRKGYTTITATFIAIALTEAYEVLTEGSAPLHKAYLAFLVSVVLLSAGGAGLVSRRIKAAAAS